MNTPNAPLQWFPGHMAKAKRNITQDLAAVDLSIIVLDARVPFSSYNGDFDAILDKKPRLIALNKEDLADPADLRKWVEYYKKQGLAVVTLNAARKQGMDKLLKTAQRLAEPVMQSLEAKGRLRRPVRALVVGSPNTGKSTLINALQPRNKTKTENRPGVTRGRQWVRVNDKIELLDTPGVLVPKFTDQKVALRLAYCGMLPQDIYDGEFIGMSLLEFLVKNYPEAVEQRYKVTVADKELREILVDIGRNRGLLAQGGVVREFDTAMMLLSEFRNGKIGRFVLDDLEAITHAGE